jgi:outer membrane lipoprotein SlyB
MKTIIALIILVVGYQGFTLAQKEMKLTPHQKVWIKELGSSEKIIGILIEVKDSSLILSGETNNENPNRYQDDVYFNRITTINSKVEIYYNRIETIKIRRKSSVLIGSLGGTLVGCLIGDRIGYSLGKPTTNNSASINFDFSGIGAGIGAVIGALGGVVAGALVGSIPREIKINGDLKNFQGNKKRIMK